MFGINAGRIDAKLTQSLDDGIVDIARLEENHARRPIQASERLVAAQAAWIAHKMTCRFCCGQPSSITPHLDLPPKNDGPGIFAGAIDLTRRCIERISLSPKGGIAIRTDH